MNPLWVGLVCSLALVRGQESVCDPTTGSIYDFSEELLDGSEIVDFGDFAGKVGLFASSAWKDDSDRDDFVSSQVVMQEPGATATEIFNGITQVRPGGGYVPQFRLFKKVEVNGSGTHPVFAFLKGTCPSTTDEFLYKSELFWDELNSRDLRWNFEKFLIDKTGKPYKRYHPGVDPITMAPEIQALIEA
ncbi:unnamed protein product [Darwinula stevensoni]|uniref:glutathione peroxidase n=1 Tax=Darwinula stevensoni TaxID=69355 RepID=A0A7R9AFN2_9CRUS|nr:unnamed protein product [Darwinula stevensoni]CAG0903470.1 unnamed protein product [Darwinula stevensoni]